MRRCDRRMRRCASGPLTNVMYDLLVCVIVFAEQQKFTAENEKLMKKFGMMRKYDDSQEFLLEHSHLACEETANYLVIWCINLEVEEVRPCS